MINNNSQTGRGKNEDERTFHLRVYINNLSYSYQWVAKRTSNKCVQKVLSKASKKGTGERGEPDLIYINENKKLLILLENKYSVNDHESKRKDNPERYAVDGVKWYLHFFTKECLSSNSFISEYFNDWKFVGIASSGDINDIYNHRISTFRVCGNDIVDCRKNEILSEADYLSMFLNIDNELTLTSISKSSIEINKKLRDIDSQKRPVLLSALMICLYNPHGDNDFTYKSRNPNTIADEIPSSVKRVLSREGIPEEKIKIITSELAFLETDINLRKSNVLKDILLELEENVIPFFNKGTNYDIIGRFYEEFLRFAGVTNVKKGIVLTPHHIAELFTDLVPIRPDDCILDCCCGTGAFLIAGMNKILSIVKRSRASDSEISDKVKRNQLVGFESNAMMYTLSISNMLFRGDGKSNIFHEDFFSKESDDILNGLKDEDGKPIKPTIGFMNPPYGGEDNKTNPTKKEIQFIEKLLDTVSRYAVVIAPLSTFFDDDDIRNRIISKHTLRYVINMPKELFMPNAATNTAIAVFETNIPQGNKEVLLCELKDDGLVMEKNKGRTNLLGKWELKKKELIDKLEGRVHIDGINIVKCPIHNDDEWILQAHSKVDYSLLNRELFIRYIKSYVVFSMKDKLNLLFEEISDIDLYELIGENISKNAVNKIQTACSVDTSNWGTFKFGIRKSGSNPKKQSSDNSISDNLFLIDKGERLVKYERVEGEVPLITASAYNNGRTSMIDMDFAIDRKKKLNENKITIDMFCNVFYHQYEYFSDDNVHTLIFSNNKYDCYYNNPYINLFLLTVISLLKSKFMYGRQVRLKRLENLYIKLPVDSDGNPDWQFMEDYIKSLPYSANL